ncbi:MAG: SurA N-terminal domain-containing protein [Actinomycetes bacterium]
MKKVFTTSKKMTAAVTAGLLALLSACTPINSAATVGNTTISIDKVQKTVDEMLSERTKVTTTGMTLDTGEVLNRNQVTFFVISELLYQLGTSHKIKVTEQEVTDEIKKITTQVGGSAKLPAALVNAGIAPQNIREYFRTYLMSAKISNALLSSGVASAEVSTAVQKLVADEADKLKVSINPRYGTWDSANATIVAGKLAAGSVKK